MAAGSDGHTCAARGASEHRRSTAAFLGIIALVALVLSAPAFTARAQLVVDSVPCSREVVAVVAEALKRSLVDARDLPDLHLVEQNERVYISNYVWGTDCLLVDAVLPTSSDRAYALVSGDEAQNLANARGGLAFVRAGAVEINEGEASLWVGTSLQLGQGDERGLTCCCGGQMLLRRDAGAWEFVRWGMRLCA